MNYLNVCEGEEKREYFLIHSYPSFFNDPEFFYATQILFLFRLLYDKFIL